ncbi:MAG TPA: Uma2 family endonuclease [Bryobacteraceae bacterium]|nr:Uma2 family endonuclease [Bryobacteraceae bacterium]
MAGMTIPALLASDDFLEIYHRDEDGLRRYELFDGEVVKRPMTNRVHDAVKNCVCKALDRHFDLHPGHIALVETTFRLGPKVVFTPDVAVLEDNSWRAMRSTFATGAPHIAIEVVSGDRADRLKFKVDTYLDSGSKAVCCIYPTHQRITVFMPGRVSEFKGTDNLQLPDLLPGFSMPLAQVFEILHPETPTTSVLI